MKPLPVFFAAEYPSDHPYRYVPEFSLGNPAMIPWHHGAMWEYRSQALLLQLQRCVAVDGLIYPLEMSLGRAQPCRTSSALGSELLLLHGAKWSCMCQPAQLAQSISTQHKHTSTFQVSPLLWVMCCELVHCSPSSWIHTKSGNQFDFI